MKFDRLASHYDWMEAALAGRRLQRTRTAWLDQLEGRSRILSVGEGHGKFATACMARHPAGELTCVDASGRMLARAQARLGATATRVRWHQSDVLAWQTDDAFDGIVTCFFLDCFPAETLAVVVARLAGFAAPDAVWLNADFALPARGLARWRARAAHLLMYGFFRGVVGLPARRLTAPDALLRTHGFELVARREFDWGLLQADVWRRRAG